MPSEEKQKINVWIPRSLWKQIESLGHDSPTKATIAAFEALVLQEEKGSNQEEIGSIKEALGRAQEEVRKYQEAFRKLQEEIGRYQEKVKDLEARPDLVTFAQLQARYEGLQEIIKEKDKSIERLENDLMKAGQREEDLKQIHNNYMLQVQSLINARALSAPSGSRTTKEANRKKQEETGSNKEVNRKFQEASKPEPKDSRYREKEERLFDVDIEESPAIKESPDTEPEVKPEVNQEEKKANTKEVTCLNCGKVFTAARATRLYCSGACKTAYGRKQGKKEASS
jgi:chromosome segregation ATPase